MFIHRTQYTISYSLSIAVHIFLSFSKNEKNENFLMLFNVSIYRWRDGTAEQIAGDQAHMLMRTFGAHPSRVFGGVVAVVGGIQCERWVPLALLR